ncbi:MAG: histidine kinase dimerization/phospho-acceptor domain-containing protein [Candidatus Scalinduaceae bacterium]
MNNELSTFNSEKATNRLKKILNESKGKVLDESLLRKIEIELEKKNSEIVKLLKNAGACKESKNLEEQIQKESKRFEDIMDVIGEGLCLLNKDLKVIWANKTISDWLDLRESPVGNYCKDIFHCSEAGIENCQALNVFKGGEGHIIETWITTKTNKRICIQRIAIPITSEKGDISNVLVHTVDVTESEKSAHRLLLLQHLGEVMQGMLNLDSLLHLILTCVTSGYAFGFNRAILFLNNKEENVLKGKLAVGPSSPEEASKIWQEISSKYSSLMHILEELDYGHNINTPFNTMTKLMVYSLAEEEKEVVASCAKVKNPIVVKDAANDPRVTQEFRKTLGANEFVCVPLISKEEPKGVIVADNIYTGEPITEDRVSLLTMFASQAALAIENAETYKSLEDKINQLTETQQRLISAEKLAAIGSVASYIAHEIRNPLVTIGGFANSLSRIDYADSKTKTNTNIILDEVRRLEKILNNLTDLSKPPIPERINVQICDIIDNTCALMENYLKERHIDLYKEFEPDIPRILADPNQIKQVILNILINSVDSMPDGGNLTIKTKTVNGSIQTDIIVMDINIPKMDGIEAMGRILSKNKMIPIIINTAYSSYKGNFMS